MIGKLSRNFHGVDIGPLSKILAVKSVFFFLGCDNSASDLALLANCNRTIQSHGPFSYFAGFLANGYKIILEHFHGMFNISVNTQKSLANIKLVG